MRIIGLAGWSGSGKTTLVIKVIPVLVERGLKVATVKHAHHDFDTDQPGKDSWLHRRAGASEVAVVSSRKDWFDLRSSRIRVYSGAGVLCASSLKIASLSQFS